MEDVEEKEELTEGVEETPTGEEGGAIEEEHQEASDQSTITEEEGNGEIPSPLASRLDALEKTITDLRMENAYLRGAKVQEKAPVQEEDDDPLPSDEEIEQGLRTAPAPTIRALVQKAERRAEKRVEKRLGNVREEERALREQYNEDEKAFNRQYGDLTNPQHEDYNQEFHRAATQVYQGLRQTFGNIPGLLTLAASTAYGQMARNGKLGPKAKPPLGGNPKMQVRSINNPLVTTRPGSKPNNGPKADPLSVFTPEEKASIDRVCKNLGITPEQYRANYDAAKKEEEGYA